MEEYKGLKLYDLSYSQDVFPLLLKFTIHKNISNMPLCLLIREKLDWSLMQKAYKIEVQRNDSMRIRLIKTKEGIKQYFLPEVNSSEVDFMDFSNSTDAEMMAWLDQRAGKKFKLFKGDTHDTVFFNTPDGQCGIYFCTSHMFMDIYGIILLLKDMMDVYASLKNGTEMPEPLKRFEDSLQRDLDYIGSEREDKDRAYFEDYYSNKPPISYCGIDGGRELERLRKKKKNPNHQAVSAVALFKNTVKTTNYYVNQSTTDHWMSFVEAYHSTFQALMHLGLHLALSASNNCEECLSMNFVKNRRAKLDDLKCGGVRALSHSIVNFFPKEILVIDALKQLEKDQLKHMKHASLSSVDAVTLKSKKQKLRMGENNDSLVFSVLPPGSLTTPNGFDGEFLIVNGTRFFYPIYHFIFPRLRGGMNFTYKMYTSLFTEEDTRNFFELTKKSIEAIIANPEGTIGEIYDMILKR